VLSWPRIDRDLSRLRVSLTVPVTCQVNAIR